MTAFIFNAKLYLKSFLVKKRKSQFTKKFRIPFNFTIILKTGKCDYAEDE